MVLNGAGYCAVIILAYTLCKRCRRKEKTNDEIAHNLLPSIRCSNQAGAGERRLGR